MGRRMAQSVCRGFCEEEAQVTYMGLVNDNEGDYISLGPKKAG